MYRVQGTCIHICIEYKEPVSNKCIEHKKPASIHVYCIEYKKHLSIWKKQISAFSLQRYNDKKNG